MSKGGYTPTSILGASWLPAHALLVEAPVQPLYVRRYSLGGHLLARHAIASTCVLRAWLAPLPRADCTLHDCASCNSRHLTDGGILGVPAISSRTLHEAAYATVCQPANPPHL